MITVQAMSQPVPLFIGRARGVEYYRTIWTDADGKKRSKQFGKVDATPRATAQANYRRWLAEWHVNGGESRPTESLDAAADAFLDWADGHYQSREPLNLRAALAPLRAMYGPLPFETMDGARWHAYLDDCARRSMTAAGAAKYLSQCRRFVRWCVERGYAPASALVTVQAVTPPRRGDRRFEADKPVVAVPESHIAAVVGIMPAVLADMIRLQLATGMRPGEVCNMTTGDIDVTAEPWCYQPKKHKTAWRGKRRPIFLGPDARAIVERYLKPGLSSALFSPAEGFRQWRDMQTAGKAYVNWPSYQKRAAARTGYAEHGEHYSTVTYAQAIRRACKTADVPHWSPGQLRHNAEQRIERHYIDSGMVPELARNMAKAVLGHSDISTTAIYAAEDAGRAREVMEKIG